MLELADDYLAWILAAAGVMLAQGSMAIARSGGQLHLRAWRLVPSFAAALAFVAHQEIIPERDQESRRQARAGRRRRLRARLVKAFVIGFLAGLSGEAI